MGINFYGTAEIRVPMKMSGLISEKAVGNREERCDEVASAIRKVKRCCPDMELSRSNALLYLKSPAFYFEVLLNWMKA